MLTLIWPHKNHWKLFDGSRDFKNMRWKAIITCTKGFQKCPLLKMSFQELKDLPNLLCSAQTLQFLRSVMFSHLGKTSSGHLMLLGHLVHSFKVLHRPKGRFHHQLHFIGLSQCIYDTYQMNLKYVPRRDISDTYIFFWFSNSRTVLIMSWTSSECNTKRGVWLSDKKWKLVIAFSLSL